MPCWRTFQINLKLSDLFCCVFFPPLLLQYVISLSQKKPGLTNKKTAGKKNITNVYSTILKIFMDEGGQIIVCHFPFYSINILLLMMFFFFIVLLVLFGWLIFFIFFSAPLSSFVLLVVQDHMFPYINNQNGF